MSLAGIEEAVEGPGTTNQFTELPTMLAEAHDEFGKPCKYEHGDGYSRRMIAEDGHDCEGYDVHRACC